MDSQIVTVFYLWDNLGLQSSLHWVLEETRLKPSTSALIKAIVVPPFRLKPISSITMPKRDA